MATGTARINILKVLTECTNPDIRKSVLRAICEKDAAQFLEMNNFALLNPLVHLLETSNDQSEIETILWILITASNGPVGVNLAIASKLIACEKLVGLLLSKYVSAEASDLDQQAVKNRKLLLILFCNLTISGEGCRTLVDYLQKEGDKLSHVIQRLSLDVNNSNKEDGVDRVKDGLLDAPCYAAYVLRNVTQSADIRRLLTGGSTVSSSSSLLAALLPVVTRSPNEPLRLAVTDVVRNCCLDESLHASMVSIGADDVLCAILYPLLGGEELSDDENDVLPIELQYAEAEKQREPCAGIRVKLLEALYQLCATSQVREYLRNKGAYYVLREYHKWEQKKIADGDGGSTEAEVMCTNTIGVLIRNEEEIGYENLKALQTNNVDDT